MLLFLPIVIPLVAAALCAVAATAWPRSTRWIGLAGSAALLAAAITVFVKVQSGIQVAHAGAWPAPYGISLVADGLSSIMVLMTGVIALLMAIFSNATMDTRRLRDGYYFLFFVLLAGVNGAFLTGDLFNLYVWFEVLLIASFVLIVLGGTRRQFGGAVKYVTMNLVGSVVFLSAAGIIYGNTGTLNMAHLATRIPEIQSVPVRQASFGLLLVAFGIKAGVFPLFSWLPASYHAPPHVVTTLFSALLTKVGVYALIRASTLLFPAEQAHFQPLMLVVASLTMVTGVLGAVAQYNLRKLLSFHIVSQIGYLIFGIALATVGSLAASIYFMVHVMAAKGALFVVGAFAHYLRGTSDLKQLGSFAATRPAFALLFAVPALSLAGLPPFSGFVGKYALVKAGLEGGAYITVFVSLAVSILTLYSMTKIWNEAFWKTAPREVEGHVPERQLSRVQTWGILVPGVLLVSFSVALSVAAAPVLALSTAAAVQLLDPQAYISAVLGVSP